MSRLQQRLERALGDRYRVERELGRGGMAVVYLAEDLRHERRVAVKVLRPDLTAMMGADRFLREIEIAAQLVHPRIVPLLDSGTSDDLVFYVMPYVEGETLRERLDRERQLPVTDAIDIARQAAAALAFAHRQEIVHRDVKPENILLTAGEAVVADFGVAQAVTAAGGTRLTESGVALGTPVYMSPEQASGDQDIDVRSDIYSLGCVLYEMLAGEPPFTGPTAQAITARKLSESPPNVAVVRATVPPKLAATVRKALARVPADRYATADRFAEALRGIEARGAGPPGAEDGAGVSRRSFVVGAAASGLLGLAGGAALSATRPSRSVPGYQRLTFQRGMIRTARFVPDSRTILYGALWNGDVSRVYRVLPDGPESHPMTLPPAVPLAISSRGEIALALGTHLRGILQSGTLARVGLAGGRPREMLEDVTFADWSPDGRELAVSRRVDGRQRLEFPVGNVVAEPSGEFGGVSFPRVSPDGERVAYIELATGSVLEGRIATVDQRGNRRILSPRFDNVFGLAWNSDEIWYTAAEDLPLFRNAIHAVGPDGTTRVVARVPGNASLHDVSPDGSVLIARTDDRGGISLLAAGETRERSFSLLDNSDLADISRDGSTILFTESGVGGGPDRSVYVSDSTSGQAVRLGDGRGLALSPDGRWALAAEVSTGVPNEHLKLLPIGPGEDRRVDHRGLTYSEFAGRWLPDGERVLVYAREGDGDFRLYVQEVDGEGIVAVTPEGIAESDWELSPDGATVAVSSDRGVELYPLDGDDPRPTAGPDIQGPLLAWIDGGLLALEDPDAAGSEEAIRIVLIEPRTGRREFWREIRPRDPVGLMGTLTHFVATPDGRSYGYSWHRALSDLYLVEGLA